MKTFRDALEWGKEKLLMAGVPDGELDAWLLLEYVSGMTRTHYFMKQTEPMPEEEFARYERLLQKRSERIPLQHLTHVQEFMGLEFYVNEHVLVPRQDTELLIELALKEMKKKKVSRLLDLCTGSGCILLSLMALGDVKAGVGSDISVQALEVARKNAASLEKQIAGQVTMLQGDLFEAVEGTFDMIVSNPPYIATKEIFTLEPEVKDHDPMLALDGMEDGLYFYRKITKEAPGYLNDHGSLLFEIGSDQGEAVAEFMKQQGFTDVAVKKDLAGLDRVVMGVYNR